MAANSSKNVKEWESKGKKNEKKGTGIATIIRNQQQHTETLTYVVVAEENSSKGSTQGEERGR